MENVIICNSKTEKYAQTKFDGDIKAAIKYITLNTNSNVRKKYSCDWNEEHREYAISCLRKAYEDGNLELVKLPSEESPTVGKEDVSFNLILNQDYADLLGFFDTNYTNELATKLFDGNRREAIKYIATWGDGNSRVKYIREWTPAEKFYAQTCLLEHYRKHLPEHELEKIFEQCYISSISDESIEKRRMSSKYEDAVSSAEIYKKIDHPKYESYSNKKQQKLRGIINGVIFAVIYVLIIFMLIWFHVMPELIVLMLGLIALDGTIHYIKMSIKNISYIDILGHRLRGYTVNKKSFYITYNDIYSIGAEKYRIALYLKNSDKFIVYTGRDTKKVYNIIEKQVDAIKMHDLNNPE